MKAAADGLVAREGAVATGDLVKHDSEDASKTVLAAAAAGTAGAAGVKTVEDDRSPAQRIAGENKTATDGAGVATGAGAGAAGAAGAGAGVAAGADQDVDDLTKGVADVDVSAAQTNPGPPVGHLVFDHPPNEAEQKIAEKLEKTAVTASS